MKKKKKFYEDLQIVHNKIPKHDIVIILVNLNDKIGKEDVYQNVAGNIRSMRSQTETESGSVSTQMQITCKS